MFWAEYIHQWMLWAEVEPPVVEKKKEKIELNEREIEKERCPMDSDHATLQS